TGLAPGDIHYKYADTASLTITTGTAAGNVFGVWENGVTTNLNFHGSTTLNIGDGNVGVQSILGTLNIQNPPSFTTIYIYPFGQPIPVRIPNPPSFTAINIDDSANSGAYTTAHMGTIP